MNGETAASVDWSQPPACVVRAVWVHLPGPPADQLCGVLGDGILAELMEGADWQVRARRLDGLQQAGADLGAFLP